MYPIKNIFFYGESAFGSALLFIFFRILGFGDLISCYLYISFIFILTAFGVYLITTLLVKSKYIALFSGFAFTCSNFMFANIDDSIVFFYFLPSISIYFLILYIKENNVKYFYISAIIGGIEIYFSSYVFIYQTIVILIIIIFWLYESINKDDLIKRFILFIKGGSIYFSLIIPFFILYLYVLLKLNIIIPFEPLDVIEKMSLRFIDFFLVLPGNIIYGGIEPPKQGVYWMFIRHYSFIGILVVILAFISFFEWNKVKAQLTIIAIVGLCIAFGVYIKIGKIKILTPFYFLYKWFPLLTFLRVTIRAYFLFSLSISILAAMGLYILMKRLKCIEGIKKFLLLGIIFIIHFFENTPFPLKSYTAEKYLQLPEEYSYFIEKEKKEILLDLPTRFTIEYLNWDEVIFKNPSDFIYHMGNNQPKLKVAKGPWIFLKSHEDLFEYNRESIYMNWQTKHKHNIIGGINGYFPTPRVIFQRRIMDIPDKEVLKWIKSQGVTYIIFHKDMVLSNEEFLLFQLEESSFLEKVKEGDRIIIFKISDTL